MGVLSATGRLHDGEREILVRDVGKAGAAEKGDLKVNDRIISIDMSDETTAIAKLNCAVPPRYFTDYLTLLKLDGRWQIVAKSFRFETRE